MAKTVRNRPASNKHLPPPSQKNLIVGMKLEQCSFCFDMLMKTKRTKNVSLKIVKI